ncbi:MAG: tRNA-binding protein [Bacteroidales bacterium]|nr:tRNA-binding protein [Bacteroidales bacterium]
MNSISWTDFEKVEVRAGTVIEVKEFPEARKPAYKLLIDFGEEIGEKLSSAQIKELYSLEELLGRQVICVINFPPKQIGPFISECLVTGLYQEDGSVVLAVPDKTVQNGARLG